MRIYQSRFFLSTLLLLYLIGRILQLFAGRVPNLTIVVFHVLPPAFFALGHGARIYRLRVILVFTGLCLGIGSFFESMSLRTGFPFGHYRFTDLMGPKIVGLPVLLSLAYVGMGYLSWIVSLGLLGGDKTPPSGRRIILLPLVASLVMTTWDLSMEAVWADVDHGWVWRDGGPYFGVPMSNFFGWLLTTYVFYQLFALYIHRRETTQLGSCDWLLSIGFYALSALGNLFVFAPLSPGSVFVDATGKSWMISSILWASRLVSVFVMLPLSVAAWLIISGSLKPRKAEVL